MRRLSCIFSALLLVAFLSGHAIAAPKGGGAYGAKQATPTTCSGDISSDCSQVTRGTHLGAGTVPNSALVTAPITTCGGDINPACNQVTNGQHLSNGTVPNAALVTPPITACGNDLSSDCQTVKTGSASLAAVFTVPSPYGVTAPSTPVLGSTAGGALGSTHYWAKITCARVDGSGNVVEESVATSEANLVVNANNLLTITAPVSCTGGTKYGIYLTSAGTGQETLQGYNAVGANYTEPTSGIITGIAKPPTGDVLICNFSKALTCYIPIANSLTLGQPTGEITGQTYHIVFSSANQFVNVVASYVVPGIGNTNPNNITTVSFGSNFQVGAALVDVPITFDGANNWVQTSMLGNTISNGQYQNLTTSNLTVAHLLTVTGNGNNALNNAHFGSDNQVASMSREELGGFTNITATGVNFWVRKTTRAITIESFVVVDALATGCAGGSVIRLYDCGTSAPANAACSGGTQLTTGTTSTTAGTAVDGSVSSANVAAAHYIGMQIQALGASCTAVAITGIAEARPQ